MSTHDDVIKWKHFPRYRPFVRGIHQSPVNSPHKGQWRGALMFSFIYAWTNGCVNNRSAGDLRRHRAQYDVTVKWRPLLRLSWWYYPRWRHQMEAFSAFTSGFPSKKASSAEVWCFLDVGQRKLLSKRSNGRWSATPWCSCDVSVMLSCWYVKKYLLTKHTNECTIQNSYVCKNRITMTS